MTTNTRHNRAHVEIPTNPPYPYVPWIPWYHQPPYISSYTDVEDDASSDELDPYFNPFANMNRREQPSLRIPLSFPSDSMAPSSSVWNDVPNGPRDLPPYSETTPARPPARSKGRKFLICLTVFVCCVLLPILIILAVLFLVERHYSFDIQPLSIDNSTIQVSPNGFSIPLDPIIHVSNDNFFDIRLTDLQVNGTHPLYGYGTVPLGTGYLQQFTMESRSEADFTFPFLVQYNSTNDPGIGYFSQLIENCTDASNRQLYLEVSFSVNYDTWAKSGNIFETREVAVPCPISEQEASSIKRLLGVS